MIVVGGDIGAHPAALDLSLVEAGRAHANDALLAAGTLLSAAPAVVLVRAEIDASSGAIGGSGVAFALPVVARFAGAALLSASAAVVVIGFCVRAAVGTSLPDDARASAAGAALVRGAFFAAGATIVGIAVQVYTSIGADVQAVKTLTAAFDAVGTQGTGFVAGAAVIGVVVCFDALPVTQFVSSWAFARGAIAELAGGTRIVACAAVKGACGKIVATAVTLRQRPTASLLTVPVEANFFLRAGVVAASAVQATAIFVDTDITAIEDLRFGARARAAFTNLSCGSIASHVAGAAVLGVRRGVDALSVAVETPRAGTLTSPPVANRFTGARMVATPTVLRI